MHTWPQAQFQVCAHHQGDLNCMAGQGTKSGTSRGTLGKTSPVWLEIWVHGTCQPPHIFNGTPTSALRYLRYHLGLEEHIICDKVARGWAYQVGGGTESGFCCRWPIYLVPAEGPGHVAGMDRECCGALQCQSRGLGRSQGWATSIMGPPLPVSSLT